MPVYVPELDNAGKKQWVGGVVRMHWETICETVLIFDRPDSQNLINGVVIIVGGSSDWDKAEKAAKGGTYQKWKAGEGYKGIGYKFVVLPNLHHSQC